MFFFVINKNLNWDILNKNLLTYLLRMKNFNIKGFHWEIWFLGGVTKILYIGVIA